MRQISGVNDRVVQGVAGVDGDGAVAERVLQSGADADGAVDVVADQQFHQAGRAVDDVVGCLLVDRLVSCYDASVGAGGGGKLIELAQNVRPQAVHAAAEQGGRVDVCHGRVDVREVGRVSLGRNKSAS